MRPLSPPMQRGCRARVSATASCPASRAGRTTTGGQSSSVAARARPAVVSFTFGCPERELVEWLRGCGCRVWCTVTSGEEAGLAAVAGVDALVVQGAEAGGHQGSFDDHDREPRPLVALLEEVQRRPRCP